MILVTGGSGLVGNSLQNILSAHYLSSSECDLRDRNQTNECFGKYRPDTVVHLAAKAGGIIGNANNLYDFYYDNITINTNVLNCCLENNVEYVVATAGTCIYPENPPELPLTEDMIHGGPLHKSNRGYAHAKRMLQVQMDCANAQYNVKWGLLLPGNLYGPHDKFDLESGHVVPSLIRRVHEAKINGDEYVTCYGTGAPLRQFTYVDDISYTIVECIKNKMHGEYNVCNQQNNSILELVNTISEVVGYKGEIRFNKKLDGIYRKDASDQKLQSQIDIQYTDLREGIDKTYQWYLEERNNEDTRN